MASAGALGVAIRARLDQVGLPARRFTASGYISAATLSRVFAGQDTLRDPRRMAELERGLGWRPGSVNQVRAGEAARAIEIPDWPRPDGDWRAAVENAWRTPESAATGPEPHDDDLVDPSRLPALLDFLFATVHPTGGAELSYEDVAQRTAEAGGDLSATELDHLRSGSATRLNRAGARALAGAFGIPTSYFFDNVDADRIRDQLTAVMVLRDKGVERIALRSAGLSEGARRAVEDMIEHLRSLEQPET